MLSRSLHRSMLLPLAGLLVVLALPASAQYVTAWGSNFYGQYDVPAGLSGVLQIACGSAHTLALRSDGTVVAWGWDPYGQATVPAGLSNVIQVDAGDIHSLALKSDGTVVAWGNNYYGQCSVPPGLTGVVAIAGGRHFSLAVKSDGSVVSWGASSAQPPDWFTSPVSIAAGGFPAVALLQDGTVAGWGMSWGMAAPPQGLNGVVQVVAGHEWLGALKSDGTAVTWGIGAPAVPAGMSDAIWLGAGSGHLVILKSDGTIAGGGPGGLKNVTRVAAGAGFSVAITTVPFPELKISPTPILGGQTATGSVMLVDYAPAGGTVVHLTSSDPAASVPPTVTVPKGERTVAFPITTAAITRDTTLTISAAIDAYNTATTPMTVLPLFAGIALNSPTIVGGMGFVDSVTVYLNGPAPKGGLVVDLSSDSSVVTLPATARIGSGGAYAKVKLTAATVTVPTPVTISATVADKSSTAKLTVLPLLASISVNPASIFGGLGTTGKVRLNASAPAGGAVVSLSSSSPLASVPATVTVPAGAKEVRFGVGTVPVGVDTRVTLTATLRESSTTALLNVLSPLQAIEIRPSTITGGYTVTGTVVLAASSPQSVTISLSSSDPAAIVPATVTVPAGMRKLSFKVKTTAVPENTSSVISATYGPTTRSATLTILNTTVASLTISPEAVKAETQAVATVTLTAPAPAGGAVVTLGSEDPSLAAVPASVTVPARATTATFPVDCHTPPWSGYYLSITATYNGGTGVKRFPIYF